jgi:hypothetical protein
MKKNPLTFELERTALVVCYDPENFTPRSRSGLIHDILESGGLKYGDERKMSYATSITAQLDDRLNRTRNFFDMCDWSVF